jgi:glycosyltransferase involved in cell wall biosynthesis
MARTPALRLVVVGDGPQRAVAEAEARRLLGERVSFRGALFGAPMRELLKDALALAVPSEWYDNAPLVVYEALAAGVPVVASRIDGLPELVDDSLGVLAPPGDVGGWSEALERLLEPDRRRAWSAGARRRAETELCPEAYLERFEAMLAQLLAHVAERDALEPAARGPSGAR